MGAADVDGGQVMKIPDHVLAEAKRAYGFRWAEKWYDGFVTELVSYIVENSIDYEAAEEALAAVSPANKANVSRLAVNAALGIGDTDEQR